MKKLLTLILIAMLAISVCVPAYAVETQAATTTQKVNKKKTGLYKVGKKYKYYKNGKFKKVTGLVKNARNGKWVYVKKGIFTKFTGVVKRTTDKKTFYVKKGVLNKTFKGKAKDTAGKVYTVAKGTATAVKTAKPAAKPAKQTPAKTCHSFDQFGRPTGQHLQTTYEGNFTITRCTECGDIVYKFDRTDLINSCPTHYYDTDGKLHLDGWMQGYENHIYTLRCATCKLLIYQDPEDRDDDDTPSPHFPG